ncbi:MAG: hypothetical protein AAF733_01295 [Verrucomicrobiota bacterium]
MADSPENPEQLDDPGSGFPLPPNLRKKLETFQQRLWSIKMAEGALAGVIGLGVTFLIVFGVDRVIDTPIALRLSLLALGFLVPAAVILYRWKRWVESQRSLEQIAKLLKRSFPRLGDELLGIVELSKSSRGESSRILVEAAMAQVDERIQTRDFDPALPAQRYGLWLGGSLAVLALSLALFALVSGAAQSSLARWIAPAKGVERYTFARIDPLPEEVVVPYAEPFDLVPELSTDTEWKPGRATVKLPGRTKLSADRSERTFDFEVPPQKEEGTLSLRVGDEYERISVTPVTRPELTDLTATLRLPDYLLYQRDLVIPVQGESLPLLFGTIASFTGTTSRDLVAAESSVGSALVTGDSFTTVALEITDALTQEITWRDVYGLTSKDPLQLNIQPVEDEEPDIFARQVSSEKIILPDEVVSFDVSANDDYGIRTMGIEWFGEVTPEGTHAAKGEKAVAAGGPEKREIEARGTFSPAREGVRPQTIQVRAFAEDYLPDRGRSYSPTFVLHVLSPQEHAEWLTQEFAKWFRSTREVYEREKQLFETNKELEELSTAETEEPENRRRLGEQASAETANAKKLAALSRAGGQLVQQAAKNEEFEARKLEAWSEKIQTLEDIAERQMPSVAENLRQSSRAPGADTSIPEGEKEEASDASQSPSPAEELLDEALRQQEELLKSFAKVADELQEILASLEASTFVKRLKAAAKVQTEIATRFDGTLGTGFGLPRHRIEQSLRDVGTDVSDTVEEQSSRIYEIQTDLEAYYQRKQDGIYKNVLDQMKESLVVARVKEIGQSSRGNLSGLSISTAEYWADTLDRWAEELVAASEDQPQSEGASREGLPPEIVLDIMKVLQEQMYLRDETREMESVKPGLASDAYVSSVLPLELSQEDLRERIDFVQDDILALPDGAATFGSELQLLRLVSDVMRQARGVLARPDTGPEVIAAQTEAIELLLQSKRQQGQGGGSGGNSPGQGGQAQGGGSSALSDITLPDAEGRESGSSERNVEQWTGKAGRTLPEEFRRGLDTYFNSIESN